MVLEALMGEVENSIDQVICERIGEKRNRGRPLFEPKAFVSLGLAYANGFIGGKSHHSIADIALVGFQRSKVHIVLEPRADVDSAYVGDIDLIVYAN